jgi:hypothetical protein
MQDARRPPALISRGLAAIETHMPNLPNRACLAAVLLVASCSPSGASSAKAAKSAGTERGTTRPAASGQGEVSDVRKQMLALYWIATVARDAVIAGDLPAARRAAKLLAKRDYAGDVSDDWRHWFNRMRQDAEEVMLAPDLAATARSIAALGGACGECHTHLLRGPGPMHAMPLAWQEPPDALDDRMYRHDVGVDQLWTGLVRPSDTAWQSGTMTLTRAPLSAPEYEGQEVHPLLAAKIEEIRGLAKQARAARSSVARAAIYGELLSRCASCHFLVRAANRDG